MSSPEDAIIQRMGREFADDFYGRLNTYGAVRYVADMFAECARFHSDMPDNKPAVGRTDAINALRQFCRAYGGRGGIGNEQRRRIVVLSVSAYNDYDDDDDYKNGRRHYKRYELIVHAEWTSSTAADTCSASRTPFVQTFLVGRPFASDGGAATAASIPNPPLEILKSVVKLMPTIATPAADFTPTMLTDAVADLRLTNSEDIIHSEGENKFVNIPKVQLQNSRITNKKKMTVRDQELKLSYNTTVATSLCPVTAVSSRPPSAVSSRPAYSGKQAKRLQRSEVGRIGSEKFHNLEHLKHEAYERRIERFLNSDYSQSFRLCVYDLDASFKVNDLYEAFGRYGIVLWARMVPTKNNSRASAMSHRQKAGLEGHVCMQADAMQRILDELHHQHGQILIKNVRLHVRKFVEE